jgi:hypothetical protein
MSVKHELASIKLLSSPTGTDCMHDYNYKHFVLFPVDLKITKVAVRHLNKTALYFLPHSQFKMCYRLCYSTAIRSV